MANAWGELSWNAGNWGDQNNVTVSVTGFENSIALNSVDSYPNQGWGSDFWGVENWGESGNVVTLTGIGLTIDSGQKEAWGQLGWNATNTEWGGSYVPEIAIGQQINASGQQLNITLNNSLDKIIQIIYKQGFTRIYYSNSFHLIEDNLETKIPADTLLVIDRIQTDFSDDGAVSRATDSISIAFAEVNGSCGILDPETNKIKWFNNRFELDGQVFQEPNTNFFAFNNPFGACKTCEGYGLILGIDEELVFPNRSLSVYEGAIAPWIGETMGEYLNELIVNAKKFDFPIHREIRELCENEYDLLLTGNKYFE